MSLRQRASPPSPLLLNVSEFVERGGDGHVRRAGQRPVAHRRAAEVLTE